MGLLIPGATGYTFKAINKVVTKTDGTVELITTTVNGESKVYTTTIDNLEETRKAARVSKENVSSAADKLAGMGWKKVMNGKEVSSLLKKEGFEKVSQTGSHAKYKLKGKGQVVVPMHGGKDIKGGTLKGIKEQVQNAFELQNKG